MPAGEKATWRRLVAEVFRLTPGPARRGLDAALCERLRECAARMKGVCLTNAPLLLGYAAMPDEPDVSPFFQEWTRDGGRLALPVWLGGSEMILREIDDWAGQLCPGRGGIMEPTADRPEVSLAEISWAVIPGRAFSEGLTRLGRGAGCYDALFRENGEIVKIGAAYDFQVFPHLPADGGDVPMDAVVTPTRIVGEGRGDE